MWPFNAQSIQSVQEIHESGIWRFVITLTDATEHMIVLGKINLLQNHYPALYEQVMERTNGKNTYILMEWMGAATDKIRKDALRKVIKKINVKYLIYCPTLCKNKRSQNAFQSSRFMKVDQIHNVLWIGHSN